MIEIDWHMVADHLLHLGVAFVLSVPIGFDREKYSRTAGLRTFPLVAIACCAFMLTGRSVFSSEVAIGRVMTGIITGMGFIGGGAILKGEKGVSGTSTAASLWSTGAIGTAVAWDRYEIAIILSIINYITLVAGRAQKSSISKKDHEGEK